MNSRALMLFCAMLNVLFFANAVATESWAWVAVYALLGFICFNSANQNPMEPKE